MAEVNSPCPWCKGNRVGVHVGIIIVHEGGKNEYQATAFCLDCAAEAPPHASRSVGSADEACSAALEWWNSFDR